MHREKLYNLQSKTYFNCILCVSKKAKLCDKCLPLQKNHFFYMNKGFFVISYSNQLICLCKNLWYAYMIANTTKHGASGLYVEKKTIKNRDNSLQKFFFTPV